MGAVREHGWHRPDAMDRREVHRISKKMGEKPDQERIVRSGGSSPDKSSARIFISYSRKDGARFAADLREKLLKQHLSVWQDIVSLEGGRDWWSQIEETLKSKTLEHFVLLLTPAALESAVMRREIRLARQEGKTVSPVRGRQGARAG